MSVPNTIVTVGTALIGNLKIDYKYKDYVENESKINSLLRSKEKFNILISQLQGITPSEKLLGPEINSTYSLLKKGRIVPDNLFLVVSDTLQGEFEGRILKKYFESDWEYKFNKVEIYKIEGLQSKDEHKFRNIGLRNLVKEMGRIIREYRGVTSMQAENTIVINATGGYKAEIAFATVIGQSYGIPVYYQFEDFSSIIELPPQPISNDFEFWIESFPLLQKLNKTLDKKEYDEYRKIYKTKLDSLVDCITERGKGICSLSPMGELFYDTCEYWWNEQKLKLPEAVEKTGRGVVCDDPTAKQVRGAENFAKKVYEDIDYIIQISSIYANKDLPKVNRFFISGNDINLDYSDGTGLARFIVKTSAKNKQEMEAAVYDLNKKFLP